MCGCGWGSLVGRWVGARVCVEMVLVGRDMEGFRKLRPGWGGGWCVVKEEVGLGDEGSWWGFGVASCDHGSGWLPDTHVILAQSRARMRRIDADVLRALSPLVSSVCQQLLIPSPTEHILGLHTPTSLSRSVNPPWPPHQPATPAPRQHPQPRTQPPPRKPKPRP